MFGQKFDYLRLRKKTIESISHEDLYIKEGSEITAYRRIYQNVEYDNFEKKQIIKFKEILRQQNVTIKDDDILLRFLYSGYFNMTNTLELYKRHLSWLNTSNLTKIEDQVLHYLEEGLIYLGGKDYQYRPIIVIRLHLLELYLFDSDSFIKALSIILVICEDYLFFPGKIENVVVIIEANNLSMNSFPLKSFQVILWMLSQNFPQVLDRMYVFNPSKELIKTWDVFSTYIDSRTLKKIQMWESKSFSPLAHGFNPDMFEMKFGGGMPDIVQYWLPASLMQQPTSIKYNIQKPMTMPNNMQYRLYNDVEELHAQLAEREAQDQASQFQKQTIKSVKKSQQSQGPQMNLHQGIEDMFGKKQEQFQILNDLSQSQKSVSQVSQKSQRSQKSQASYGAPKQAEKVLESFDKGNQQDQDARDSNVQACLIM